MACKSINTQTVDIPQGTGVKKSCQTDNTQGIGFL